MLLDSASGPPSALPKGPPGHRCCGWRCRCVWREAIRRGAEICLSLCFRYQQERNVLRAGDVADGLLVSRGGGGSRLESPSGALPSSLGGHPAFPELSPLCFSRSLCLCLPWLQKESQGLQLTTGCLEPFSAGSGLQIMTCAGCRRGHFLQDQRSQPVRRALRKNWVNVKKPIALC